MITLCPAVTVAVPETGANAAMFTAWLNAEEVLAAKFVSPP